MAEIKKEVHGKDSLTFNITPELMPEPVTLEEMEAKKNERNSALVAQVEQNVYQENLETLTTYLELFENCTDIEKALEINKLHKKNEFTGPVIGGLLKLIREDIERGKTIYKSYSEYHQKNIDLIGFSYSMACSYMEMHDNFDMDAFKKLGTANCIVLSSIKDKKTRDKLTQKALDIVGNEPAKKTKDVEALVVAFKQKENAKIKEEKRQMKEDAFENHTCSIESERKGEIIITVKPKDTAKMLDYLNKQRPKIIMWLETAD